MVTNPRAPHDQENLNERLRSLRIDRGPVTSPSAKNGTPKLLLLGISVLIALAAFAYFFLFSSPKSISAAEVKNDSGTDQQSGAVLSVSGYVVSHHKIDVGAKVLGRVSWIGVEKGDKVQAGQVLVRLEDNEFRAQSGQARANLAAGAQQLGAVWTGLGARG